MHTALAAYYNGLIKTQTTTKTITTLKKLTNNCRVLNNSALLLLKYF